MPPWTSCTSDYSLIDMYDLELIPTCLPYTEPPRRLKSLVIERGRTSKYESVLGKLKTESEHLSVRSSSIVVEGIDTAKPIDWLICDSADTNTISWKSSPHGALSRSSLCSGRATLNCPTSAVGRAVPRLLARSVLPVCHIPKT